MFKRHFFNSVSIRLSLKVNSLSFAYLSLSSLSVYRILISHHLFRLPFLQYFQISVEKLISKEARLINVSQIYIDWQLGLLLSLSLIIKLPLCLDLKTDFPLDCSKRLFFCCVWQSACSACQIHSQIRSHRSSWANPAQSSRAHIIKTTKRIDENRYKWCWHTERGEELVAGQVASGKLGLLGLAAIGVATWHMAHKVCMVICVWWLRFGFDGWSIWRFGNCLSLFFFVSLSVFFAYFCIDKMTAVQAKMRTQSRVAAKGILIAYKIVRWLRK